MPYSSKVRALVALVGLVAGVQAQSATLGVPKNLSVGDVATVTYSNPAMAGATITVVIDNGMRESGLYEEQTVQIRLDETGQGCATWTVPDWFGAKFNAPGAGEVFRTVMP